MCGSKLKLLGFVPPLPPLLGDTLLTLSPGVDLVCCLLFLDSGFREPICFS